MSGGMLVPHALTTVRRWQRAREVSAPLVQRSVAVVGHAHDPHPLPGPGPCDRCPSAERCRALLMCCRAFVQFVEGPDRLASSALSLSRLPSRRRYVKMFGDAPLDASIDDEREHVLAAIDAAGSVPSAATLLGMEVNALYRRVARWRIAMEARA